MEDSQKAVLQVGKRFKAILGGFSTHDQAQLGSMIYLGHDYLELGYYLCHVAVYVRFEWKKTDVDSGQ